MPHQIADIDELHRGQDAIKPFTINDEAGNAKDLTGASAWFYALNSQDDNVHQGSDTPALTKSTEAEGGVAITAPTSGELEVTIEPTDYDNLPKQEHYYELWVEDASGKQTTPVHGRIILDK